MYFSHQNRIGALWLATGLVIIIASCIRLDAATPAAGSSVDYNFTTAAELRSWEMDFPDDWEVLKEDGLSYLHMKRSREPGVPRRPLQFARLKNLDAGSFDLHVKVRQLQKSAIVVFNYVDTLHFYYAHISSDPGSEAVPHNGIFLVDGGPRRRIAGVGSKPALPDRGWHDVRIVRDVQSGSIKLFVDNETEPRFAVMDHTIGHGQVGLGSFDETGDFAHFQLQVK